ncbi:MAG: AAA family ATPase [Anaerolineae bacterium]|nr:MAG: ATPase AAA [Chloroflexi bacterium OLB13]MBW7878849.1 AAA family ATPase [Anaerolineae bacterium]
MTFLRELMLSIPPDAPAAFPYSVPFVRQVKRVEFPAMTFLAGENGSGKSTLLEALACAAELPAVGAESVMTDPTLADVRGFAQKCVKLVWNKRTRKGFFLRTEDFFGFAKRVAQDRADAQEALEEIERDYRDRSGHAKGLARMPHARSLLDIHERYGEGLDANSHGEGFFKLFQSRFSGPGLYLMDEPEAALSPTRQLTLLSMLHRMIGQGAQFVIATHSPILMAYPNATIYAFSEGGLRQTPYDTLEHVVITREFLANPNTYLRHLLE